VKKSWRLTVKFNLIKKMCHNSHKLREIWATATHIDAKWLKKKLLMLWFWNVKKKLDRSWKEEVWIYWE
jgi:hypothetical protein